MAEAARAKPKPTPETQHFWDGTQAGELRLQRCGVAPLLSNSEEVRTANLLENLNTHYTGRFL